MPFRATFACLWCGTDHATRGPDDLEGWAHLCPTCVGKAGENNFLRSRVRQGLAERGVASGGPGPVVGLRDAVSLGASPPDDDWYLRRGSASQGPIHDAAFLAELDAAGRWLDTVPLRDSIVQLQAGTGWWAPLVAGKGELSLFDVSEAALDLARERLVAHGLRAHLHVRDPWSPPEQAVDAVLLSRWLGGLDAERVPAALAVARAWLRPGGRLVVIDAMRAAGDALGGNEATTYAGFQSAADVGGAIAAAGFTDVDAGSTGRFLVLATALAPG